MDFKKNISTKVSIGAKVDESILKKLKDEGININKLISYLLVEFIAKNESKKEMKHKEKKPKGAIPELAINEACRKILEKVTQEIQQEWLKLYGQQLLLIELPKAYAWLLANPSRSKKDIKAYIARWIARAHLDASSRKELKTTAEVKQEKLINYTYRGNK